jgi:hypothetical protein
MGRTTHSGARGTLAIIAGVLVLDQIVELLGLPESGEGAPTLDRLEDTLTDGYARALALDAERWRIERRLSEIAREANGDGAAGTAKELAALSERLTSADGELARLRAVLAVLQQRARGLRSARR